MGTYEFDAADLFRLAEQDSRLDQALFNIFKDYTPSDTDVVVDGFYIDRINELKEHYGHKDELAELAYAKFTAPLKDIIEESIVEDIAKECPYIERDGREMERLACWTSRYVESVASLTGIMKALFGWQGADEKARIVMDMYRYKMLGRDGWDTIFGNRDDIWYVPEVGSEQQWAHIVQCEMFKDYDREYIELLGRFAQEYDETKQNMGAEH